MFYISVLRLGYHILQYACRLRARRQSSCMACASCNDGRMVWDIFMERIQ